MIFRQFPLLFSVVGAFSLARVVQAKYPLPGVQTGVNPQTGARPARRNILDLQNDVPTWSLYIQALTAMQQTPEDDLLSYFQIAGIHGRPYYAWDGYEQDPSAPLIGYCTHFDILFTTWHRPYLALFEQILANHTHRIAKAYNSPVYQAAADNFRIPYWDWASIPTMPDVVTTDTVHINTPSGPQDVPNPLLTYKFQEFPLNSTWFPSDQDGPLSTLPNTIRSENANGALSISNLMKDTYATFAQVTDWDTMSTGGTPGRSFEYSHNQVHQSVGSGRAPIIIGHMGTFSYSAFDPLFFLHHANVDRLFAMWETIRPKAFLTPSVEDSGTFTIPLNSPLTVDTPLAPFTMGDGETTYTSTTSRFTQPFGYSYPEIQDWLPRTPAELAANVTAAINTLYNPNETFGSPMTTPSRVRRGLPAGEVREWSITLQALNTALNDRYTVSVFLGPSTKVGELLVTPPPAAIYGPLTKSTTNHVLDLNDVLKAMGVDTEDVNATISALKSGLSWNVVKGDGTTVPNEEVEGLKIGVWDDVVRLPIAITELPTYGNKTAHPEVTAGKAGGVRG